MINRGGAMTPSFEVITKEFLSKRDMVEFLHFLENDRVLIETTSTGWRVSYEVERTVVYLQADNYEVVTP